MAATYTGVSGKIIRLVLPAAPPPQRPRADAARAGAEPVGGADNVWKTAPIGEQGATVRYQL